MPASPAVKKIWLEVEYVDDMLIYTMNIEWRDSAKWLITQLAQGQITHRSRIGTIAYTPLQLAELAKRTLQMQNWNLENRFSRYQALEGKMSEIFRLFMDETIKHLEFNADWIISFISDHKKSSVDRGLKWSALSDMNLDEWKEFYNTVVTLAQAISSNEGRYLNLKYNSAIRARSDSLVGNTLPNNFEGTIDRSRIVLFNPLLSSWNIFIPNKKSLYTNVLKGAANILGVPQLILYPYSEGGTLYSKASELFNQGLPFKAIDGKNWESAVGNILGPSFRAFYTNLHGIDVLPSGIWATSLLGTLATLVTLVYSKGDYVASILGDDLNVWGNYRAEAVPYMEEELLDSKFGNILGLGFKENPDFPRVYGVKAQSDRADKALPLRIGASDKFSIELSGRHSNAEIGAWIGAYLGYFGGKSLIEAVRNIDFQKYDYIAPHVIIQDLTNPGNYTKDYNPFEWLSNYSPSVARLIKTDRKSVV